MKNYKEETINAYDSDPSFFESKFSRLTDLTRRQEFEKFSSLLVGKKILDLGCGAGDHSVYFKNHGFDITWVDLSKEMIKKCKEKGLNAVIMDMEHLDFPSHSFDGIWAVSSLLHIPKDKLKSVLKKIRTILKVDGILYVSFKEGEGEKFIEFKSDWKRFFSLFSKDELLSYFKEDFDLIEFHRIESEGRIFLKAFFKKKD